MVQSLWKGTLARRNAGYCFGSFDMVPGYFFLLDYSDFGLLGQLLKCRMRVGGGGGVVVGEMDVVLIKPAF